MINVANYRHNTYIQNHIGFVYRITIVLLYLQCSQGLCITRNFSEPLWFITVRNQKMYLYARPIFMYILYLFLGTLAFTILTTWLASLEAIGTKKSFQKNLNEASNRNCEEISTHWFVLKMARYIVKMVSSTKLLTCAITKDIFKDVHCKLVKQSFWIHQESKSPEKTLKCRMIFNPNLKSFFILKHNYLEVFIFDIVSKLVILWPHPPPH